MTREEHIYQLKLYLKGLSKCMVPASSLYWKEHYEEIIEALEQEPTTENDLGVDCISKEQTIQRVLTYFDCIDKGCDDEWVKGYEAGEEDAISVIKSMPSVTPQEPQIFKWCRDCREYDQENHCCHRWSKVIRDTVEEMKQEYIEREVLDKVRAEIEQLSTSTCTETRIIYIDADDFKENVLAILDKYKAEQEE